VVRVPSLPALPPGTAVELAVDGIDLLELTLRCDYAGRVGAAANSL